MPEQIELHSDAVHFDKAVARTIEHLRRGSIVLLPTETVYGLAVLASNEAAVKKLVDLKGRRPEQPFPVAIGSVDSLLDDVPEVGGLALRFARRCWPGSVSLVLDISDPLSRIHLLPEYVKTWIVRDNAVCFRVPNRPIALAVLQELNEPVILTSANETGEAPIQTVAEAAEVFGDRLDLMIDDGPAQANVPSTVVKVDASNYTILREGVVRRETIDRLSAKMILFVCTGNTCRSPLGEKICEQVLSGRLGCRIDQLEEKGYVVMSAGIAAGTDVPASTGTRESLRDRGLDASDHASQLLNEMHVKYADIIFAMTRTHREAILSSWPSADTRLFVLRTDGGDIADPIGGNFQVYEDCARSIEQEIRKRIDEIV